MQACIRPATKNSVQRQTAASKHLRQTPRCESQGPAGEQATKVVSVLARELPQWGGLAPGKASEPPSAMSA